MPLNVVEKKCTRVKARLPASTSFSILIPNTSAGRISTHPSPPKECLIDESMRLPRGLLEKEHEASTATAAKKVPANSTDGRVTPYRSNEA